jgi:HEAT repeat protein
MKESCDSQNILTLIGCLEDRSWRIRARAVDALVAFGEETLKPLKVALKKDDNQVKSAAVTALCRLGREDLITADLL